MTDAEIAKIREAEDALATAIGATADMAKKQSPGLSDAQALFCAILRELSVIRVRLDQLEDIVGLKPET